MRRLDDAESRLAARGLLGVGSLPGLLLAALLASLRAPARGEEPLAAQLRSLPQAARVLMVGAHPDDEDSALLAHLALREGLGATYLSLTRGEGGQNRIGDETGAALGVLRTGELLAARDIDGASQLLGPFIDFGYSKTPGETFRLWGRERLVGVIVQAIRQLRPDLVISVWQGAPADGHGHHQACGIATREAFERAGDPGAFPAQIAAGLDPWRAGRLLVRALSRLGERPALEPGAIACNVGAWDSAQGRSSLEAAMEGRSLHRSQDMGALRPRGPLWVVYRIAAGRPLPVGEPAGGAASVADGLPRSLDGWVREALREGGDDAPPSAELRDAVVALARAWTEHRPASPEGTGARLLEALERLRRFEAELLARGAGGGNKAAVALRATLERVRCTARRVEETWARAVGVEVDALASHADAAPGESEEVTVEVFARGQDIVLEAIEARLPAGWSLETPSPFALPTALPAGQSLSVSCRVTVPVDEDAALGPTTLPWARLAARGSVYDSMGPLDELSPVPVKPPSIEVAIRSGGSALRLIREIEHRSVDPGLGEARARWRVVPAIVIEPERQLIALRVKSGEEGANEPSAIRWSLRRSGAAPPAQRGELLLRPVSEEGEPISLGKFLLPEGLSTSALETQLPRAVARADGRRDLDVFWKAEDEPGPAPLPKSDVALKRLWSVRELPYPHVRRELAFRPARLATSVLRLEVAPNLRVAYIPGAGDPLPAALEALGIRADVVDGGALSTVDWTPYEAVIVGIRALETRPEVAAARERLWAYAHGGGTVIVQYQKPLEDGPGRFIPFKGVAMRYPAPRVTDETAPVRIVAPGDPILRFPNVIDASDFEGWTQERGLYFAEAWPAELSALLESSDPGETPLRGGLLHARLGRGHYVYCAYALFRQLPAGVPGAYRLLANLVSLPRSGG